MYVPNSETLILSHSLSFKSLKKQELPKPNNKFREGVLKFSNETHFC